MPVCRFCDTRVAQEAVTCPNCGAVQDLVRHAEEVANSGVSAAVPVVRPSDERGGDSQRRALPGVAPQTERQLAEMVARGEIIQAVKAYRQLTGASLADAKDYIDSFPKPSGAAGAKGCGAGCLQGLVGCLGVIVALVCALVALALFFG